MIQIALGLAAGTTTVQFPYMSALYLVFAGVTGACFTFAYLTATERL